MLHFPRNHGFFGRHRSHNHPHFLALVEELEPRSLFAVAIGPATPFVQNMNQPVPSGNSAPAQTPGSTNLGPVNNSSNPGTNSTGTGQFPPSSTTNTAGSMNNGTTVPGQTVSGPGAGASTVPGTILPGQQGTTGVTVPTAAQLNVATVAFTGTPVELLANSGLIATTAQPAFPTVALLTPTTATQGDLPGETPSPLPSLRNGVTRAVIGGVGEGEPVRPSSTRQSRYTPAFSFDEPPETAARQAELAEPQQIPESRRAILSNESRDVHPLAEKQVSDWSTTETDWNQARTDFFEESILINNAAVDRAILAVDTDLQSPQDTESTVMGMTALLGGVALVSVAEEREKES